MHRLAAAKTLPPTISAWVSSTPWVLAFVSSQLDNDWVDAASRPGWLKLASIMSSRGGCFLCWTWNFRLYKPWAGARILHRDSLLTSPGHVVLARLNNYWIFSKIFFFSSSHWYTPSYITPGDKLYLLVSKSGCRLLLMSVIWSGHSMLPDCFQAISNGHPDVTYSQEAIMLLILTYTPSFVPCQQ